MSLSSWGTSFRQAGRSLTSSGLMSLASVAAVAISLLVLSVTVLLVLNVREAAATVESQVEARVELLDISAERQQELVAAIKALEGVEDAIFISKEEGLEQFRQRLGPDNQDILTGLEHNPLPDIIQIKFSDATRVVAVSELAATMPGVTKVDYGRGVVERLLRLTDALRTGGTGLVILLIIATVLTISNTIRLAVFARRREIAIMKLVGATDWFIRRPFVMEGILLGAAGAGVAMLITSAGYDYLVGVIRTSIPFLPVLPPEQISTTLTTYLLILGAVLGAIGSSISIRRFLRV